MRATTKPVSIPDDLAVPEVEPRRDIVTLPRRVRWSDDRPVTCDLADTRDRQRVLEAGFNLDLSTIDDPGHARRRGR